MRLSKKLLATLLPIAATATVAPVLTSCNNASYDIQFGDSVNCLNEKEKGYHSMNDVKNTMKTHAPRCQEAVVDLDEFPQYDGADAIEKQAYYYDLIASHSLLNETKFKLVWGDEISLSVSTKDGVKEYKGTSNTLKYVADDNKKIFIQFQLTSGELYKTQSYRFQHTIGQ